MINLFDKSAKHMVDHGPTFDVHLAHKFDTFVGGHLTDIGTRQNVEITKEFTLDVYNTVKSVHNNMDATTATAEAVKTVGTG